MNFSAAVIRKLTKELQELQQTPCEGIRVTINEQNIADVQAEIEGPVGTPFEGGLFRMRLSLPPEYPAVPPKGHFLTKVFHPNIAKGGEICVNVLKKDWTPDMGVRHVLMVVRCLLIQPFPDSALNEEAGKLLLEDYDEFAKHARLMTSIHAACPKRSQPTPLTTSGANSANGVVGATPAGTAADGGKKEDGGSPALKKAKPESKGGPAVSKVKKSLKRL